MLQHVLASCLMFATASCGLAADALQLGDSAGKLAFVDSAANNAVSLEDYQDAKLIVLCFTSVECPISLIYEPRFKAFDKQFSPKGVRFIAVNASQESPKTMAAHAKEQAWRFPFVTDPKGQAAARFGVKVTTHVVLLDQQRKLVYTGAFDNNLNDPSKHYLADAVNAALMGEKPPIAKTRAHGCPLPRP